MIAPFGGVAVTPRQMRKRPGVCLGGAGGRSRRSGARMRHLFEFAAKARTGASGEAAAVWPVGEIRRRAQAPEARGA
jgi:hypothetical protein